MKISEIQAALQSSDSQERLRGVTALRKCDSAVALPMLLSKVDDREFMVRSFVAMGLRETQTAEAFAAMLKMMQFDRDPNVRAEAANSLSMFGTEAISHWVEAFVAMTIGSSAAVSWLRFMKCSVLMQYLKFVRSLLAANIYQFRKQQLTDLVCWQIPRSKKGLEQLLPLVSSDNWGIRLRVARALSKFDNPQARAAVSYLAKDPDHRVAGATLEASL